MGNTPYGSARGQLLRAKVLEVYLPDDPAHPYLRKHTGRFGEPDGRGVMPEVTVQQRDSVQDIKAIVCDVLVFGDGHRGRVLSAVPVMQRHTGLSTSDRWIPRGSRCSATYLGVAATMPLPNNYPSSMITAPADLDGDTVIIGFLSNDVAKPVILGCLDHEHTQFPPPAYVRPDPTHGPINERNIAHRGSYIRIDADGNIDLDAWAASSGEVNADGSEVDGVGGRIGIRTDPGQVFRAEAGTIEFAQPGVAATNSVARVGDTTNGTVNILASQNDPVGIVLAQLSLVLDWALGFGVPGVTPPPAPAVSWFDYLVTVLFPAGITTSITTGNPNVKTD